MREVGIGVLVVGIALRVALDLWSLFRPAPWLNIPYAALFAILGVWLLVAEGLSVWSLCSFGIATWSVVSFFVRQRRPNPSLQPTVPPSARS
jgi:hypothetical protein